MIGKYQESIRGQHLIMVFGEMCQENTEEMCQERLQEITEEICQKRCQEEEEVLDQKDERV